MWFSVIDDMIIIVSSIMVIMMRRVVMIMVKMMEMVMFMDVVMNDLISKSNQPNALTDPVFLPSSLPTALGTRCSENCGQFAASLLLCLGSLRIICLFAHDALDFSVLGCFHRYYIVLNLFFALM